MAKSIYGRIGSVLGTMLTIVTTNWGPIVSATLALGAAGWAYATQWGYLAALIAAFATFAIFVWLINGVIWFRHRNALIKPEADIRYALAYTGSVLGFNTSNQEAILQIGVNFLNTSNVPIWYRMDQFDVVIVNRTLPNPMFNTSGGVLAPGVSRAYKYPSFTKNDVADFIGKNSEGSVLFSASYGQIGKPAIGRLLMRLSIFLRLDDQPSMADGIVNETYDVRS